MHYETDFEAVLKNRKAELEARLRRIEDDLEEPTTPDNEDRATELEDDEILEGIGQAGARELLAVNAAIERIRKGTFGTCVRCGEPISEARLKAVPHAAICEECIKAG